MRKMPIGGRNGSFRIGDEDDDDEQTPKTIVTFARAVYPDRWGALLDDILVAELHSLPSNDSSAAKSQALAEPVSSPSSNASPSTSSSSLAGKAEAMKLVVQVALMGTVDVPHERPTMKTVLEWLCLNQPREQPSRGSKVAFPDDMILHAIARGSGNGSSSAGDSNLPHLPV